MRALTYHGAEDVRVETVPDPIIQEADDIILRVTATAICGSDLHLYRGKIPETEQGDIFGHEFMGVVEEVGPAVTQVKKGDRVIGQDDLEALHVAGVDVYYLITGERTQPNLLSEETKELLKLWNSVEPSQKDTLMILVRNFSESFSKK